MTEKRGGSDVGSGTETLAFHQVRSFANSIFKIYYITINSYLVALVRILRFLQNVFISFISDKTIKQNGRFNSFY